MKQPMPLNESQVLEALEQYINSQGIYSSNVSIRCSNFKSNAFSTGYSVDLELTPRFTQPQIQQQPQVVYVLPAGSAPAAECQPQKNHGRVGGDSVTDHATRKLKAMRTYAETCLRWLDDSNDPDTRVQLYHERTYLNLSKVEAQMIESAVLQWKQQPQKRELAGLLEA